MAQRIKITHSDTPKGVHGASYRQMPVKVESRKDLDNQYFATTKVIIDSGKDHQWLSKNVV